MPSALQSSRDFLARQSARIRSGIDSLESGWDKPGPEIRVEPFDAQNVSTSAGLIKLGTSIAAARRQRANAQVAMEDMELDREKTRAEIARIRAEADYYGTRPPPGTSTARPAVTITHPQTGQVVPKTQFDAEMSWTREQRAAEAARRREAFGKKLESTKAALTQLDEQVNRDTEVHALGRMEVFRDWFDRQMRSGDKKKAGEALLKLGIDPANYASLASYDQSRASSLVLSQMKAMEDRLKSRVKANIERYYDPKRRAYMATIDELTQSMLTDEQGSGVEGQEPMDEGDEGDEQIDFVPDGRGGFVPAPR